MESASSPPQSPCSVASTIRPLSGYDAASAARRGARLELDEDHQNAKDLWNDIDKELQRRLKQKAKAGNSGVTGSRVPESEDIVHQLKTTDLRNSPAPASQLALTTLPKSSSAPTFTSMNVPSRPGKISLSMENLKRPMNDQGVYLGKSFNIENPTDRDIKLQVARDGSKPERSRQMSIRAADSGLHQRDIVRRKLRMKIADLCTEVSRRQELQDIQDKARKFRERREKMGRGPAASYPAASLGDHSDHALGIIEYQFDDTNEQVSPRRAMILNTLNLEEIDELRRETRFFFVSMFEEASKDLVSARKLETLIEFFIPSKEDKALPVAQYARKLRRLAIPAPVERSDILPGPIESLSESAVPITFMPCLGKTQGVRDDHLSPTFSRIKDIAERKEQQDAQRARQLEQKLAQRDENNAMKCKEQMEQVNAEKNRKLEAHKQRLDEAMDSRQMAQSKEELRLAELIAQNDEHELQSCIRAERTIERKRAAASANIDGWKEKAWRAEQNVQRKEYQRIKAAEHSWDAYTTRIWKIGLDKHTKLTNDKDHTVADCAASLITHLRDEEKARSTTLMKEINEKQTAASTRREVQNGARYDLVGKAFGQEASEKDLKHKLYQADRRTDSWMKSAAAWKRESKNYDRRV